MKKLTVLAVSAVLLAGCAAHTEIGPRDYAVDSFDLIDAEEMNSDVLAAAAAGEEWQLDALSVAQRFVKPIYGRYLSIEKVDEPSERPRTTTITIIRGSYLDDSVWGEWDQLLLSRQPEGAWLIDEARRAWRCYRGHQTESFGERWCL